MVVESQRLLAVGGIFRVINVEHQCFRWGGVTSNELIDQGLAQAINIFAVHGVLEAGDGRTGGECTFGLIGIEGLRTRVKIR